MAARKCCVRPICSATQLHSLASEPAAMPSGGVASMLAACAAAPVAQSAGWPSEGACLPTRIEAMHTSGSYDRTNQGRAGRDHAGPGTAGLERAGFLQTGRYQPRQARPGQLQIGDVAGWPRGSIPAIEHEGSTPSFTAERTGDGARDRARRSPRLRILNNDRVVPRDQHGPRDAHVDGTAAFGASVVGWRATRAASPSLPRRAAAGRRSGRLPSGRRFEPPDA